MGCRISCMLKKKQCTLGETRVNDTTQLEYNLLDKITYNNSITNRHTAYKDIVPKVISHQIRDYEHHQKMRNFLDHGVR